MSKELNILKKAINTFPKKDKIKVVAVFGSHIYSKKSEDLDIITISDKEVHDHFIHYLLKQLKNNGFKSKTFVTIKKKPKKSGKNMVLIHDLWYKDLNDMRKREWKTVVNTIRRTAIVIHGKRNYLESLPVLRVSRDELLNPMRKWAKKIKSNKEVKGLESYLNKILPMLKKEYSYLKLDVDSIRKDLIGKASRKRVK